MAGGQGTKRIDIAAAVETSDAAPRFKESSEDGGKLPCPIPNVHWGNTQSPFMPSADHKTGLEDLPGQEEPPSPVAAPQDPSDTAHHEIEQPGTVYEDRKSLRPEDHDLCSRRQGCIAYNAAPPELYQTKHAAECPGSGCYMVKVPYGNLVQVIQGGGVPLLSIQVHSDTEVSLHVHERQFRSDYATFSHVWADGLGNPKENALPFCQIKVLQFLLDHDTANEANTWIKYVDNTMCGWPGIKMFWIDTLCIPTQDSILRSQCIDAMSSIYAGSSRVFVLDKELMETPMRREFGVIDISYCLIRIACSVWMCRSWTLQEAILPERCLFLFADGAVFQPASVTHSDSNMSKEAIEKTTLRIISADREPSPQDVHSFTSIWNNLAGRSTTQPEDLHIVLASCLGFKLRQFQAIPNLEGKVKRIIFSYPKLPLSLFFNPGPRLRPTSNHNNRWAPTQEAFLELRPCEEHDIILIDEVVSVRTMYTITTTNGNCYNISTLGQENDTFQTTGYAATCFIFSSQPCLDCSVTWGASFLVSAPQVPGTVDHKQSVFEMVYFNPAILTPRTVDRHSGHGNDGQGNDC
ncbi:hypothetical protein F5883DRAFT_689597 [Diaporthe sp. PMI_573]|nr:hypothetical protein F5883DRAFT_689597 [Diaporthaceae sp. PMI_573]